MTDDNGQGRRERVHVALLLGGDSSEREISFKTGKAMHGALAPQRFVSTVFDVSTQPVISASASSPQPVRLDASRLAADEYTGILDWWNQLARDGVAQQVSWNALASTLNDIDCDVVLPALHGGWGEDGTVQALLEVAGLPYVGSPQRSSVIALDKQICKAVMRDIGISVPRGMLIRYPAEARPFDGPCVVKPNAGGSSVGVTVLRDAHDDVQWRQAVGAALVDGSGALVEELIEGAEVTAAVLGEGDTARVLPLIEIVPESEGGFYDFTAKYAAGGSRHLIPPRLSPEAQDRVAGCALRAHHALGCRGVTRSDYIVTADGTPHFLEINTLPGMTQTSLVPDAARATGISFEALVEKLVEDALQYSKLRYNTATNEPHH
jgi:D-alanine-D-alanine ligase